jgi:hypothetical protein
MKDIQGRQYARLSDLKEGDIVQVDSSFTCLVPWNEYKVHTDISSQLYIRCKMGRHYLDGQLEDEFLIGVYPVEKQEKK